MAQLDNKKYPCNSCGSSDARRVFVDGLSHCFSCKKTFNADGSELGGRHEKGVTTALTPALIKNDMLSRGFRDRLITKPVAEFFGVKVGYSEDGEIDTHYYPYDGGKCYKERKLPKQFAWIKEQNEKASDSLFGAELFNGGGKRIIITEGEIDAMSVAEASLQTYKKIYPVVAMSSAGMTKSLIKHREWLRSFGEIVLCLDDDAAGEVAKLEAIRILGVDKVKIAKLPLKDPNCILTELGARTLQQCIYDAARHIPSGIITKEEIWERMSTTVEIPATPYPDCLNGLNNALKGMRSHEIVLLVSGTGCGKSTIIREIELHLQETTTAMIGIIHLEEPPEKCATKLVSMKMNVNAANQKLTLEEMRETFNTLFSGDRLILLDHQGSMKDSSIMDKLEYMCLMGCKFIFIDHITILVSEGVENEKGNEAQDKIMSDLLKLVNKYEVCIILVSHLRKTSNMQKSFESGEMPTLDAIKGSGAIKQIAMDIIAFARDTTSDDEHVRNTTEISILKARETGRTGRVASTIFDNETGRLHNPMFYRGNDIVTLTVNKETGEILDIPDPP